MTAKYADISQAGRIGFQGLDATKFWARALGLEEDIKMALNLLGQKPKERDLIACPVINEYQLDERLKLIYVVVIEIDAVGLREGGGVIFYASPDRETEVREHRDHFADDLMKSLTESDKPHEVIVVETGKEHERNL